jgi:HlyD family secretion protein
MKRVIYILATIVAVSCSNEADYDAQGTFEATEVVISAEGTGRILNFDIVEGEAIESNSTVGAIDSLQLHLQREQLKAQQVALLSSRPDKEKQVASLRSQIAK